jgi:hypothetical protein
MTDEPDLALTGAAFELANAGYAPMPDPDKKNDEDTIGSDSASLRAAAEQRQEPSDRIETRGYVDDNGDPAPRNEAVTLERAARDYGRLTAIDRLAQENASSEALATRVDAMRAEAMASDPDAAEFYGFEVPQDEPEKVRAEDATGETAHPNDHGAEGLDPELAKALQHPQVAQAIEQRINEAEKTRQEYLNGIAAATQIAQMSFLNQFPELASLSPEHLPGALEQMSRQDPDKFARVQNLIENTDHMLAQQRQESLRQAELSRRNFDAFAKSEDARLDSMLKGEPKAMQRMVSDEIVASARESGVEPAELFRLFNSEPLMRNAVFQRMMYDAGKYRLMMKAKDAAAAKPVPPVQRPGMARTPAERGQADVRTLSAKLSNSGDIKDAVALYSARKSGRR